MPSSAVAGWISKLTWVRGERLDSKGSMGSPRLNQFVPHTARVRARALSVLYCPQPTSRHAGLETKSEPLALRDWFSKVAWSRHMCINWISVRRANARAW